MQLLDKIKTSVYTIAEMSANHAGSLDNALLIVDAAKDSGADCLKIQTYTADTMTINCDNNYFKIKGGLWDGYNLYNLYQDAYTPWEWHEAIKKRCDDIGIDFLSTPFDKTAVDFLENLNVQAYKVASFELVDIPLITYIASKGKPIIISCGMGSIEEITDAIEACRSVGNNNIILLKCTSEYPANPADMNLDTIIDMRDRFNLPVGISDHSMGNLVSTVAVSLGACVVEKHFCLSRQIPNPDSAFSMEPSEFKNMVNEIRQVPEIKGKTSYVLTEHEQSSLVFRRSIFAIKNIKKGEPFTAENIRIIRPGNGALPKHYNTILSLTAQCDILMGEPIKYE